jgi:hypothetical protein
MYAVKPKTMEYSKQLLILREYLGLLLDLMPVIAGLENTKVSTLHMAERLDIVD